VIPNRETVGARSQSRVLRRSLVGWLKSNLDNRFILERTLDN